MSACNEYMPIVNIAYNEGIFVSDVALLQGLTYKHIFVTLRYRR